MDADSDEDDNNKRADMGSGIDEENDNDSPIPMPELPPPHLSAAKGDIPRLIILNNMDTKLIVDAVDSVNRHPLFYAVAHGHVAAAEFILSTVVKDPTLHINTNNHFKDSIGNIMNPVHAAAMIFDSMSSNTIHQGQGYSYEMDRSQLNETIDKTIYHVIYSSAIYHTISHMDVYGDTVIHAAAAGGSEKILSLLLQTISDFIKTTIHNIYREFMDKLNGVANEGTTGHLSLATNAPMKSFLDEEENGQNMNHSIQQEYENMEKIYSTILTFLVNNQNSLGLTPAHLSTTSEILEVLHNHHANLLSTDFQQRSVLFIACAMNKDSCVEYLISSLDNLPEVLMSNCMLADDDDGYGGSDDFALTEQYADNTEKVIMEHIMKRDYRGDTPLHAAACNNAVESLLILLQSGIDPRLMNDKQYTAYDLAVKNNHEKCVQILAEYTLHYCTSSEFDSVLFLKTLEVSSLFVIPVVFRLLCLLLGS
jgi:ankyrin repeat protein